MLQRHLYSFLLVIISFSLSACLGGGQAPVYSREKDIPEAKSEQPVVHKFIPRGDPKGELIVPKYYRVIKGDTLYSIAFRYGLDYKKIAHWNNIATPFVIRIGQNIQLEEPPMSQVKVTAVPSPIKPIHKSTAKPITSPTSQPISRPKVVEKKVVVKPKIKTPVSLPNTVKWQWPATGKLLSSNTVSASNGIDIKGKKGQKVKAAAAGDVVYSSNALVGYGNLIIIQHNETYLSAYAHNDRLLVGEGATVKAGQVIAEMGDTATNQVKLHFEIRKDGKSVNPLKYLPN